MKETHSSRVEWAVTEEGHYDQAAEKYTQAIETIGERDPKAAPYFSNRAMCYLKSESYSMTRLTEELAIDDGVSGAAADPSFAKAYYRQGSGYFFLGKLTEALTVFKEVILK